MRPKRYSVSLLHSLQNPEDYAGFLLSTIPYLDTLTQFLQKIVALKQVLRTVYLNIA